MRVVLSAAFLFVASTVTALADCFDGCTAVPEIDAFSGLAAMGVVGSIATLFWERRRGRNH